MVSIIPSAQMTRRRYGAGKLWAAPEGTITNLFAPTVSGGKFTTGFTTGGVPGSNAWLPVGLTKTGTTITPTVTTATDDSAEYYDPLNVLVTGRSVKLEAELLMVNLTNLRLALNAGTDRVTGTPDASTASRLSPPSPGSEKRFQWLWQSSDDNMLIVLYKGLNEGALKLQAQKGANGMSLPLSVSGTLPDAAVADQPYDIWVSGTSFAESVSTE